jgi:hypothetical protein
MKVQIADIDIGERRREKLGDIAALARSIEKYGLLHPIVLSGRRLVAGERRLRACQHAGFTEIEATDIGDLDEVTLREIELEENERRKRLTAYERSREMVERAAQVRSELVSVPPIASKPGPKPKDGVSERDIAEALGVDHATVRLAEHHVAAVDRYPELLNLPQSQAIATARELDTLPEPERDTARQAAVEGGLRQMLDDNPDIRRANVRKNWTAASAAIHTKLLILDPDEVAASLEGRDVEAADRTIRMVREWLDRLEPHVAPRELRVVGGSDDER